MGESVCKRCLQKEYELTVARKSISELVQRHNANIENVKKLKERWEEAEAEVRQAVLAESYAEAFALGETDSKLAHWLREQIGEKEQECTNTE